MAAVALPGVSYLGGDVLPELVAAAAARNRDSERRFTVLDLTSSELPPADLLFCRDCLVHLSIADAWLALANVKRAPIDFLLTTTFPGTTTNIDITTGDWRPLNLERAPFSLPRPRLLVNEGCTESDGRFRDKSLGLWSVAELPTPP
jgi:hypothetical protein